MRTIAVVTGSRAEYGLLKPVMARIRDTKALRLQVVATGSHFSPEFGSTYREIEADGFAIDGKVEMLVNGDTPSAITKSMGLGLIGFADALAELRPDLMLVLGDRYEIFAAVAAALIARIPVAHAHGGETTEGAYDEAIRHSITKMSHLHFVAAEEYGRRVIQLGESPSRVFVVGGLGVDAMRQVKLLDRKGVEDALGFSLGAKSLLVTFHPATLESDQLHQTAELLSALDEFPDTQIVFTLSNADTGGRAVSDLIRGYVAGRPNTRAYASLGQKLYLSSLAQVDGVVGNSSSGIAEAPSFRKGTVNVGDRQRGRLKAASVIDCAPDRQSIGTAIRTLYSKEFQARVKSVTNPYGDGGASERIVDALMTIPLEGIIKKAFHDIPTAIA